MSDEKKVNLDEHHSDHMEQLIRKRLATLLPKEMVSNGQVALEHVLLGINHTSASPDVMTASYTGQDRKQVICNADFIELITLWRWGYELKSQDNRCMALCCKLLRTGIR
jgi:hypothetical protein